MAPCYSARFMAYRLVGYARVSTTEQNPAAQLDMLNAAGCERVFVEAASGAQRSRPELTKALDYIRKGDARGLAP